MWGRKRQEAPELEALRVASGRAKDLFDIAMRSGAPQSQLDALMQDWQDSMERYHDALRR